MTMANLRSPLLDLALRLSNVRGLLARGKRADAQAVGMRRRKRAVYRRMAIDSITVCFGGTPTQFLEGDGWPIFEWKPSP